MMNLKLFFLITTTVVQLVLADECVTPNNETGICKSLYSCPILLSAALNLSNLGFLRQSNCGGTPLEPLVCCGPHSNFTKEEEKPTKPTLTDLLPGRKICGQQHSDDYFHTVNDTVITEFPWLAALGYRYKDEDVPPIYGDCSGSLINNRYVLTAAYCVTFEDVKMVGVRLGEYSLRNDTDCFEEHSFLECSEHVQDFDIEKVITHPKYVRNQRNQAYDIALIRLKGAVQYSDYIRPICLPLPGIIRATIGDTVITSGWGAVRALDPKNLTWQNEHDFPEVKKRTYSNIITNEECQEKYHEPLGLKMAEGQICGRVANYSEAICDSDVGGPVMYVYKRRWHQEAIISYGIGHCVLNHPGIFTDVVYYLDWIEENLEP